MVAVGAVGTWFRSTSNRYGATTASAWSPAGALAISSQPSPESWPGALNEIRCGDGEDFVEASPGDRVASDCERVERP